MILLSYGLYLRLRGMAGVGVDGEEVLVQDGGRWFPSVQQDVHCCIRVIMFLYYLPKILVVLDLHLYTQSLMLILDSFLWNA